MSTRDPETTTASCLCGAALVELRGAPIVATCCHCTSCRAAGELLDRIAGAPPVRDSGGGTPYVLFRKDRVRCARGRELLVEHRLVPTSPTRRVVATCCGTALFLDFTKGHWISIYRGRLRGGGTDATAPTRFFMLRLLAAWVAMGFRTPTIDDVRARQ
jgi:hypothetical protein